ncbi:Hint domain-containing protein [Planktotalea lamellibrachiae]|nr:Hint domain-containing protein [Aliiroseovarius lamellibrachiae]
MFVLRETQPELNTNLTRQDILLTHGENTQTRSRVSDAYSASGISSNAPVRTARGIVSARDLRAGDQIHTYDNGLQTLFWAGSSRVDGADGPLVRVLKSDGGRSQLLLAPNHLVLQKSAGSEMLFGESEVLCPAKTLVEFDQFEPACSATPTMVHLLFDRFQLIQVGEIWVESYVPDMERTRFIAPDLAAEIIGVMPKLAHNGGLANYVQSRLVLEEREVKCLNC